MARPQPSAGNPIHIFQIGGRDRLLKAAPVVSRGAHQQEARINSAAGAQTQR